MSILTRYGGALLAPVTAGFDSDARSYIARVEAADGQPLEDGVRRAINQFVVGCKADNIWNGIKASCILVGARTLNGALVPLVGAAPTNFNFVSGDYNRKTGLVGDGSTKYLNSNRNSNADPQNNFHISVYATTAGTNGSFPIYIGAGFETGASGASQISPNMGTGSMTIRNRNSAVDEIGSRGGATGLLAIRRSSPTEFQWRLGGTNATVGRTSQTPVNDNYRLYGAPPTSSNARLAFYSIGESVFLILLDARVTTLVNAIGAALP